MRRFSLRKWIPSRFFLSFVPVGTLERRCSHSGPTVVHGSTGGNGGGGGLFWQWKIHNFASLVQVNGLIEVFSEGFIEEWVAVCVEGEGRGGEGEGVLST